MPEKQGEGDPSTKASHQKSLCVNRIQFAWNRHIEDILDRNYYPTGDFGLDTLRKLAALAESEPLSRVKPILLSCIHERANNEAHDGHSRAKGLTRADVLKAKDIIEQQNWVPHAKDVVRKKRALSYTCAESASPDSPPTKCARPRSLVAFRIRTDTSKSLDALRTSHGELDLVSNLPILQSLAYYFCRVLRLLTTSVLPPQATAFPKWKRPTTRVAFRVYST